MNKSTLGGLKRFSLYGPLGNFESRSKGGKKSTAQFKANPELARVKHFAVRTEIQIPEKSSTLAELVGILLGDGSLPGSHQVRVTFDYRLDLAYAKFIAGLFKDLFGLNPVIRKRKKGNGADVVVNSTNLVNYLFDLGLKKGHKVRNQAAVPKWIEKNLEFKTACLRGLMDTDGGPYVHRYKVSGKVYFYLKLCFTNYSAPLRDFVYNSLSSLNYKATRNGNHVSVHAKEVVRKYFTEIGSSNPRHRQKFDRFGEMPERPNGATC